MDRGINQTFTISLFTFGSFTLGGFHPTMEPDLIFEKYGDRVVPGSVLTLSSIWMGPIPVPAPMVQFFPISIIPNLNLPEPS